MCAYTHRGWAHKQRVSTICLARKNSHICCCAPDADGVPTSGLSISSPTLYQLSHLATPSKSSILNLVPLAYHHNNYHCNHTVKPHEEKREAKRKETVSCTIQKNKLRGTVCVQEINKETKIQEKGENVGIK